MRRILFALRDFFVSLRLTVALLVLSIVLVFAATLNQVHIGVLGVQEKYFHAFIVFGQVGGVTIPVFPGGYLLGGFLLVNLTAAHLHRFRISLKRTGIWMAHSGLILLLVGELLSGLLQRDYHMRIVEGETRNYAESDRRMELAVIDETDPKVDKVVAIPAGLLSDNGEVQSPGLPFRILTKAYYPNAALQMGSTGQPVAGMPQATMGMGPQIGVLPEPLTYKEDETNVPAAFIELVAPEGSLGTWLVSPSLGMPQRFPYNGRNWKLVMRLQRQYEPFSLTLLKFSHDVYPGTDIPLNFSSRIRMNNPDGSPGREVLIYMNNPLRTQGLTFYQAGYDNEHTTVLTVVRNPSWLLPYISCGIITAGLLVQFIISLSSFLRRRPAAAAAQGAGPAARAGGPGSPAPAGPARAACGHPASLWMPLLAVLAGLALLVCSLLPPGNPGKADVTGLGRLPIMTGGRVKPLDTVARSTLLMLAGHQYVMTPDRRMLSPDEWLADVLFSAEKADTYQTFVIDNPDVLGLIGRDEASLTIRYAKSSEQTMASLGFLPSHQRRFSYAEIAAHIPEIDRQAQLADGVDAPVRTLFQNAVLQLDNNIHQYVNLKNAVLPPADDAFLDELLKLADSLPAGIAAVRAKEAGQPFDEAAAKALMDEGRRFEAMADVESSFLAIPPEATANWTTTGQSLLQGFGDGTVSPYVLRYAGMGVAWRRGQVDAFNHLVSDFRDAVRAGAPAEMRKCRVESLFNSSEPFSSSMTLYVLAFLAAILSWLKWPEAARRTAFVLIALAWVTASLGIGARMWIEGRPPVTNLYSSALFIGWAAVLLCLFLEASFRNAIGTAAAGLIGFATLIIANHLALSGDTMEPMRAVLNSNFWLGTHVVVVTLGYAATFLAGMLALIYIFRGLFTRSLDPDTARSLERMVYGIVCFATLFSFVGTVLGGIWADQSWGRFWGWDPKENGALIIVVWNAVILHARWGGMIRQHGLMTLAVIGNIVTAWSWFGTNMLGIGLHSYGFTQAAFIWLIAFVASQLIAIGAALIPPEHWASFGGRPKAA